MNECQYYRYAVELQDHIERVFGKLNFFKNAVNNKEGKVSRKKKKEKMSRTVR